MQDINIKLGEFMRRHRKELTLVLVSIFSTIILVVGFSYLPNTNGGFSEPYVSAEFLEARRRVGNDADKITNLTNISRENLDEIKKADIEGNYTTGLALIADEIDRNDDIRNTAEDLSEDLRDMAKYLDTVQPREATEIAVGAVTVGIELVQRLIVYNNNADDLFDTLQVRFQNGGDEETRAKIEKLISTMNDDASAINSLSNEYRSLMIRFDGLTQ